MSAKVKPQYPVNLIVEDRPCLVVGGGSGIGLYISDQGFFRSSLGFAIKNLKAADLAA